MARSRSLVVRAFVAGAAARAAALRAESDAEVSFTDREAAAAERLVALVLATLGGA